MTAPAEAYRPAPRTTLRRKPQRGRYDRAAVHAILDAGLFCHVGQVVDGQAVVTPTIYWRMGERLYWHGQARSRPVGGAAGAQVCLTVTLLDGLVLAKSAFRHSVRYRSVMAFGEARPVADDAHKLKALKAMIERLYPGRWDQIRPPSQVELDATGVVFLELKDVSAKTRTDGVLELGSDLERPAWSGVLPVALTAGAPEPCAADVALPAYLRGWEVER